MITKQKAKSIHKNKLQLLATKNTQNWEQSSDNTFQNEVFSDQKDPKFETNLNNNSDNSKIKFTFLGQNLLNFDSQNQLPNQQNQLQNYPQNKLQNRGQNELSVANSTTSQNSSANSNANSNAKFAQIQRTNLTKLRVKLIELQNDKKELQQEIQNLQAKIKFQNQAPSQNTSQNTGQNLSQNQSISQDISQNQMEAKITAIWEQKTAKQNWQLTKENEQVWNQFQKSQSDKLEILKQRVFWQNKAKEKQQNLSNLQHKIEILESQIENLEDDKLTLLDQNQLWQEKWGQKTQKTFHQQKIWRQNIESMQRSFVLQIKTSKKNFLKKSEFG